MDIRLDRSERTPDRVALAGLEFVDYFGASEACNLGRRVLRSVVDYINFGIGKCFAEFGYNASASFKHGSSTATLGSELTAADLFCCA
jgi:hypothetical protein